MILDKTNQFSDAQVIPVAVGATLGTDVIDTFIASGFNPNTLKDLGNGEGLWFSVVNPTVITSGGTATLAVALLTDDNATLTTPTVIFTSPAVTVPAGAGIPAGTVLAQVRIPNGFNYERYLGVRYTVGTAVLVLPGSLTAFLNKDIQNAPVYAKNYTIS